MGFVSIVNTSGGSVDLDTVNAYFAGLPGMGMPPLENIAIPYGQADGALYQRTIARPRVMTLILEANLQAGSTYKSLHQVRAALINLVKPDRQATQGPLTLRYQHETGGILLEIECFYDEGLEFGSLTGFNEKIAMRLISYDPYWRRTADTTSILTVQTNLASTNNIVERSAAGVWSNLGGGLAANGLFSVMYDSAGNLYAGGDFATIGGVSANNIAKWTGTAWAALGSGVTGGVVHDMAIAPNGNLYVAGTFTGAGGIANTNKIAIWTGTAWAALNGGGVTAGTTVQSISFDKNGNLWVGGTFTGIGGIAATNVAKYSSTGTWSSLGTGTSGGSNAVYRVLATDTAGPYIGGSFTTAHGVAVGGFTKWTGTNFIAFSGAPAGGATEAVYGIAQAPDGALYLVGSFTTAGGVTVNGVTKFNGVSFISIGSGFSALWAAREVQVDANGTVYVVGTFTSVNGLAVPDGAAKYIRGVWQPIEIDLPGSAEIHSIALHSSNKLAFGMYGTAGTSTVALTTVTNTGTAKAYPVITVTGPSSGTAYIYNLINYTTGDYIYFNNLLISTGETITLDLRPGYKTLTSSWRGNIIGDILPGSNEMTFSLLPGSNSISLYMSSSSATASMAYRERHWSTDGVA